MNKIAVCFRGEIRTGVEAAPNVFNFIGDLLPYCDFFVHTWEHSHNRVLYQQSLQHLQDIKLNMHENNFQKIEEFKNIYKPKLLKVENYDKVIHYIHSNFYLNNINSQNYFVPRFYSWKESVNLKKLYEFGKNFEYEWVVCLRPDTIYNNKKLNDLLPKLSSTSFGVNGNFTNHRNIAAVDDHFFMANSSVMDEVSDWQNYRLFNAHYEDLFFNPHWDVLHAPFNEFIKKLGYEIVDLNMPDFSDKIAVLRKECLQYDPILEFEKCEGCDKLIYWNAESRLGLFTDEELYRDASIIFKERKFLPQVFQRFQDLGNVRET